MTIDDPALEERRFTATHERIIQALVEQLHEVSTRLNALETEKLGEDALAPPAIPATPATQSSRPSWQSKTGRQAGWQPARR